MGVEIGTDRKIVRHRPHRAPQAARTTGRRRVVVVGGGIAGLSAATGLAERGVDVRLIEREPHLGGRAGGWTEGLDGGEEIAMSRGFHAFFRQYYNLRQLLQRTDPRLERLTALEDYPLLDSSGRLDSFRGLPRTPPWNAVAFALRSPTFRKRDLLHLDPRAAAPLGNVTVPGTYHQLDHVDAESFLRSINFPPEARHLAFEVFSRSFFAPPSQMSAAELAAMFHIYFLGSTEGILFDVPNAGFDRSLWTPLQKYLTDRGTKFLTGTAVQRIDLVEGRRAFEVHDDAGRTEHADGVVLAADVAGLREIVDASPTLHAPHWTESVRSIRTAPPFFVHRLWLDAPVAPHRPAFLGTAGRAPLDNISVLDRYDRDAQDWATRHGGSVVELHAYAIPADRGPDRKATDRLRRDLVRRLHEIYPETARAGVLAESFLWREDCPMFGLGDFARRPGVATPHPGLVLAGDGIRIDLPVALMERAATTGWHAANRLLERWGLPGHDLFSVPTAGRSAVLRWLAARVTEGGS
ncbi:FAD-dependent oxidoreductase [Saccharopolyspora mangrovi]|uniref:FAD-dependent oxidoreductase n=1 Tax=Saccharopolyspora mangrovi TaxID=3082379 RepID=A0ABU6A468_9PSEU|nr:FAD-dependent oxidoreductase [Saccharopolyspora sp. S2-29]MEB3366356.1 FAD-dependent oxidoreductase [Saccharopolyspora sp. S2-29]